MSYIISSLDETFSRDTSNTEKQDEREYEASVGSPKPDTHTHIRL